MKHYYFMDCKLNRYLRKKFGIEKPYALEWGGWEKWDAELKASKPLAFFFTETVPHFLDDTVYSITEIWNKPKRYIRNRYIDRTHILPTDLQPGQWWDSDSRLVSGMRQLIIDHVEIELAWKNTWDESKKWKFVSGRCSEAGLDYLQWEKSLRYDETWGVDKTDEKFGQLTHQAISALEIEELYNWCKNLPNRPDAMDVSGWSEHCDLLHADGNSFFAKEKTDEERERGNAAHKRLLEIEKKYDEEETEMLTRIVKIRKSLWT
jgi:hypothetical protein